jgi:hypothetical protein
MLMSAAMFQPVSRIAASAVGQIIMRKVDAWQTLPMKLPDRPLDAAA